MLAPTDFQHLLAILQVESVLIIYSDGLAGAVDNARESAASNSVEITLKSFSLIDTVNEASNPATNYQYGERLCDISLKGHDLVYVCGLFDTGVALDPTILIASLRDACQGQLILEMPTGADQPLMARSDFFALGFRELRLGSVPPGSQLYRYSLCDYKTTPDWFNSRYWAHPERWNTD